MPSSPVKRLAHVGRSADRLAKFTFCPLPFSSSLDLVLALQRESMDAHARVQSPPTAASRIRVLPDRETKLGCDPARDADMPLRRLAHHRSPIQPATLLSLVLVQLRRVRSCGCRLLNRGDSLRDSN